eukprot:TRINITY_DN2144_c0_g1_i1.p1 TRINITY_DN2144_c0_g1~~TRINITY_DN2144_c0_g1_i1.p1  ORF type:complete len:226 (-),score=81.10 TRINITY_DN2144_c0_g1_i1:137-814(-)
MSSDLNTPAGIGKFNGSFANKSYVVGYTPSKADADLFGEVTKVFPQGPEAKFVHAKRWYDHINSYSAEERAAWTAASTTTETKTVAPAAAAPAEETEIDASVMEEEDDLFGDVDEEATAALKQKVAATTTKKPVPVQKSNVVLDVKPTEAETDMDLLESKTRAIAMEGLVWGPSKFVDVAYGVRKLQITAVVVDDLVSMDDLEEKIMEFEDLVQSVDVAAMVRAG